MKTIYVNRQTVKEALEDDIFAFHFVDSNSGLTPSEKIKKSIGVDSNVELKGEIKADISVIVDNQMLSELLKSQGYTFDDFYGNTDSVFLNSLRLKIDNETDDFQSLTFEKTINLRHIDKILNDEYIEINPSDITKSNIAMELLKVDSGKVILEKPIILERNKVSINF